MFLFSYPVCQACIDLAFVIDASGSIEASGRGNFKRCLNFVKRLVASFKISPRYARVGAVVYSSKARMRFGFKRYYKKRQLMKAIDRIPYLRRGTRTGYALWYVQRYLFRGQRRRCKRVLIVMTDGRSSDRVRSRAKALHRSGINTFAIGIGKNYNMRQLIQIASFKRNVYVARFRNLPNIVRVIKSKACKGKLLMYFRYTLGCSSIVDTGQVALRRIFPPPTTFLLFSLHYHHHHHIFIVFPLPPPPPRFYRFLSTTTTTTTFLLFSVHHHHHLFSIVCPPLPPPLPNFYCFPSTTTTTFFLLFVLLHHHHHIPTVFPPPPPRPHFYVWEYFK